MFYDKNKINRFISSYQDKQVLYKKFSEYIYDKMKIILKEREFFYAYIIAREKSIESLTSKCNRVVKDSETGDIRLKYENPETQITDLAGVRIICYLPGDIEVLQNIVKRLFVIDMDNSTDKKKLLESDKVGYLSVHYVVSLNEDDEKYEEYRDMKCEIQIRSELQDAWAQVFHDRLYKKFDTIIPEDLKRDTNLAAGALELLDKQIDNLARRYDRQNGDITNRDYQLLLEQPIDKCNLIRYFKAELKNAIFLFYDSSIMFKLIKEYGYTTIGDIDNVFREPLKADIERLKEKPILDTIIIYILMIDNYKIFFETGLIKLSKVTCETYSLLEKYIDIDTICNENNIKREDN